MERKVGFQVQKLLSTCNQKKKVASQVKRRLVPGNDKKFGRLRSQQSNLSVETGIGEGMRG
jgi:hypothetical protein